MKIKHVKTDRTISCTFSCALSISREHCRGSLCGDSVVQKSSTFVGISAPCAISLEPLLQILWVILFGISLADAFGNRFRDLVLDRLVFKTFQLSSPGIFGYFSDLFESFFRSFSVNF